MNWLLFRVYKLGWKWPYIRWRIYRWSREEFVLATNQEKRENGG